MALKKRNKNEKSEKKSQRNKKYTTSIKRYTTSIKRLNRTSDLLSLKKEFIELQSKLDKAVVKGIIHLNKANRLKHRLSKGINDKEINSIK